VHVEDVVGSDGVGPGRVGRPFPLAGEDEAEGRAQARVAVDLQEDEIVAPGEELHLFGGDALVADRAQVPVRKREAVVQRIHPDGSVAGPPPERPRWVALWSIPPGGIIPGMTTTEAPGSGHGDSADHFRHSYTRDKSQLVRRLARIEGQVRGITRMIEREEYCVDILQQTSALRAAVDSLAVLVLEDHVSGCVRTAAANGDADRYVEEVVDVVRRTLGRPVRSAPRG
jgi:DNA-binding FrmR family transcriptional regulator